jgi:sigma-B regulation protein RsbU (phosphoserine phosphatase)
MTARRIGKGGAAGVKKRKFQFTIGRKMVVMILAMSLILGATSLLVSYLTYHARTTAYYTQLGNNLVKTLASQIDPSELDHYYETGKTDDAYFELQNFIRDLVKNNDVQYLYIVRPHGIGVTFLFDSDMEAGEKGEYAGGYCALGTYVDLAGGFADNLDKLLAGEQVDPIVQKDASYGWLMTAMTPVLHDDGTMAGYVMADINMNEVVEEQQNFLLYTGGLLLAMTAVFAVVYLIVIRKSFIRPVQQLTRAAGDYEGGHNKQAFASVDIRSHDELSTLADAFRMMLEQIEQNNTEQKALAVREQQMQSELQLAYELNASTLPKDLPAKEGGYPFAVCGRSFQGGELECDFYDYFLLGPNQLCILVGKVPGSGIPQALYTVMAQATLKSQLRSGQTLETALSAANRQLFEMSSSLYLNVLVGILDGITGQFSCINAGQRAVLALRNQSGFEQLRVPSCAPLGQNENVVYQTVTAELHQGDRVFLHTDGLDDILDASDKPYGEERLRQTLNLTHTRQMGLEQMLLTLQNDSGEYAADKSKISGYAMLAMEYRRKDRAQAHCSLAPGAAGSAQLASFLQGQLSANGLQKRQMAKLAVLADELFVLCSRYTQPDGRLMAECAVPEGEHLMIFRLKGSMGGHDPVEHPEGESAVYAADFIKKNADRVLFEHDDFMDTVTVVKRLEKTGGEEGEVRT